MLHYIVKDNVWLSFSRIEELLHEGFMKFSMDFTTDSQADRFYLFTVFLSSKEERVKGDRMFSTTQGNIFRHGIMMTWLWKKISFGPQLKVVKINGKLFQKVSDEELRGKLQLKSTVQQILYDRSAFSLLTSFYFPLKQAILKSGFFTLPECRTHVLRHKSKLPPTKKTHKAVH